MTENISTGRFNATRTDIVNRVTEILNNIKNCTNIIIEIRMAQDCDYPEIEYKITELALK